MSKRRRAPAPALDPWEDEGRRLAPHLAGMSAAVCIAHDAHAAARVAIGLARAAAEHRRVAIADLDGRSPALRALAGESTGPGILESFQQGVSLNEVARPAADGPPSLFVLPLGGYAVSTEVLQSPRWHRLASGFAQAGALLLIVARADSDALDTLVRHTDGVIAIGDVTVPIAWRVVAQVTDVTPSPAPSTAAPAPRARRPHRVRRAGLVLALIAAGASGFAYWQRSPRVAARAPAPRHADSAAAAPPVISAAAAADTVSVPVPVNPQDSARAASFAVVLVATNTASGANSWLRDHGPSLPAAAIAPMPLGAARIRWFRVVAGAWRDRTGADSLLAALRAAREIAASTGVVAQVPLALLMETNLPRDSGAARVAALGARGVQAYALMQDDGSVRVYAGAFETAAAAAALHAELRAMGLSPQLSYRTGRTF